MACFDGSYLKHYGKTDKPQEVPMFNFLPAPLRGILCAFCVTLNALVIPFSIVLVAFLRIILPLPQWQAGCYRFMNYLPILWSDVNRGCFTLFTKTQWEVSVDDNLDLKGWYFLVSNHRSWSDILILYIIFSRKAPTLKFFLKQELIWIPGIGLACKALHFPFMSRYTKSYLKKHPEKKGKDLETTRKACEAFKLHPSTIILFPESSRFTSEKQRIQGSPYRFLLRPKSGMLALSLSLLGDYVQQLIDVTIAYNPPHASLWDLLCGRVKRIYVRVQTRPIPAILTQHLQNETEVRKQTQQWLNTLWEEKDKALQDLNAEYVGKKD